MLTDQQKTVLRLMVQDHQGNDIANFMTLFSTLSDDDASREISDYAVQKVDDINNQMVATNLRLAFLNEQLDVLQPVIIYE